MAVLSKRALGFAMLCGTLVLWVGSSAAIQAICGHVEHFQKPFFITLFNGASAASLLLPHLLSHLCGSRKGLRASLVTVLPLSATLGLLWLFSQWLFNMSLVHTSLATNTVLSSASSVFTFGFSLLICRDPFRWLSFGAALLSFMGCSLVAMDAPGKISQDAVSNSTVGDALALCSAALFSLVSVLLRRFAGDEVDMGLFMGLNGLIALCLSPALLWGAHSGGVEAFTTPSSETIWLLALNALLGCTIANYLYTSAMMLLSPLVASVCLSLSIPLSAATDGLLLKQHSFDAVWKAGAALVVAGVICAAVDFEAPPGAPGTPLGGGLKERDRANSAELESLLGAAEGGDEDEPEACGEGDSTPLEKLEIAPANEGGFRARAQGATSARVMI